MVKEYFTETGENPSDYEFCIASASSDKDTLFLRQLVEEYTGQDMTNRIFQIGITIGTYTGPGAIGVCFVKKYNRI
jgi:fatty acid-binding protein DegV